jgi:hypothetical protein
MTLSMKTIMSVMKVLIYIDPSMINRPIGLAAMLANRQFNSTMENNFAGKTACSLSCPGAGVR